MNCPFCTSKNTHQISHYSKNDYKLFECKDCLGQFWTPFKNPGAEWYERDERYSGRNHQPLLLPNWNHKKVISFLKEKKGKVLDIGCGTGNFLAHAKERGWDPYGIDFDRDAIATSKEVFHLENTYVTDLTNYVKSVNNNSFDLITFFDVFEHIDNHNEFLNIVKGLLKNDGYVAMSMPYRNGARWLLPHDLPPRHLTRWDRTSIKKFLEKHGFCVKYIARRTEGINFLVLKLRFRYGKYTSFNIVSKIRKMYEKKDGKVQFESKKAEVVHAVSMLAKIKDLVLFGIPAVLIWIAMLFSPKRYVTLYVIAQKNENY